METLGPSELMGGGEVPSVSNSVDASWPELTLGSSGSVSCSSQAMDLRGSTTSGQAAWCSMYVDRLPPASALRKRPAAEKPTMSRSMWCASRYSHSSDLASPCSPAGQHQQLPSCSYIADSS